MLVYVKSQLSFAITLLSLVCGEYVCHHYLLQLSYHLYLLPSDSLACSSVTTQNFLAHKITVLK